MVSGEFSITLSLGRDEVPKVGSSGWESCSAALGLSGAGGQTWQVVEVL